ncbi:MAG TPA: hypothetical protein VGM43_16475 [Bryobacteraceae bacterium]
MSENFRFRATAVGASGFFSVPFNETIDARASSALSGIGGYDSARADNYRLRELLSFGVVRSEVIGSHCPDEECGHTHTTVAKATVENLNVMDIVTADRIVANLVSIYPDHADGDTPREPSVRLLGSRFENLRIAGIPVHPVLNVDTLDEYDTLTELQKAYPKVDRVRELFGNEALRARLSEAPSRISRWFHPAASSQLPFADGLSSTSLVRELKPESSGLDIYGHVIHLKGFGAIRLGEVQITRSTRSVTMLQIDFDCPLKGRVGFCFLEDGGSPPW